MLMCRAPSCARIDCVVLTREQSVTFINTESRFLGLPFSATSAALLCVLCGLRFSFLCVLRGRSLRPLRLKALSQRPLRLKLFDSTRHPSHSRLATQHWVLPVPPSPFRVALTPCYSMTRVLHSPYGPEASNQHSVRLTPSLHHSGFLENSQHHSDGRS
jgi:hypothetical protein